MSVTFLVLIFTVFRAQAQDACLPSTRPSVLIGCGDSFNSTNYPDNYEDNALCQWLIQSSVSPYGVVVLNLLKFETADGGDVLTIFDGENTTAPVIARLSGSYVEPPGGFFTTQPFMLVQFETNSAGNASGFSAAYRARSFGGACSPSTIPINVTSGAGVITSPNFPDRYFSSLNCGWLITSSAGQYGVVKIEIHVVNTEVESDVVSFYDGRTANNRLLGNFSGSINSTLLIQTTQPYLLITFKTDASINLFGFSATFTSTSSGGECSSLYRPRQLSSDGGKFTSPNFPSIYFRDADCQWILNAVDELFAVVTLDFEYFDTETDIDFVSIYDGSSANGRLIARLTGYYNQPPTGFTSTLENMLIVFTSASYDIPKTYAARGFSATYRTTTTKGACSPVDGPARLTTSRGQISSPNYPFSYYSQAECRWSITAVERFHVVTLNFYYFNTEPDVDVLSIFDGSSVTDTLIANISGYRTDLLGPYMSTGESMYLRFVSDQTMNYPGFTAEYTTTTIVGACSAGLRANILYTDFSIVSSPNYPGNYFANADCQWQIIATQPDGTVSCQFSFFELDPSDQLIIYDGNNLNVPVIAILNGSFSTPPGPIKTTQRQMFMRFLTDEVNNARGFSAICRDIAYDEGNPCSPLYRPRFTRADGGSLQSPQFPRNYTSDLDCQWLIATPSADGFVALYIDEFQTELDSDFLYVYDGNTTNSPLLARLHGSNCIPVDGIFSTQPFMLLRFTSDKSISYRGFSINFASSFYGDSCSASFRPRSFSGAFGTFTSPSYPRSYFNNADCSWLITSDRGPYGVVTLDFDYFDTEQDADYVFIFNGNSENDQLLYRFHGSYDTLPSGITSTQAHMFIRFTSDDSITARGFSANYKSTTSDGACLTTTRPLSLRYGGIFSAPNYTVNYYSNADCSWLIDSSSVQDGVVRLDFIYFNTELDADFLYIFDGPNENSPLIARLSGTYCNPPSGYTSTQRYMFLRFTSDNKTQFDGFGIKFSSLGYGGACSPLNSPRLLSGTGGTIASPNYPFNYYDNADCQWLIEAQSTLCEVIEIEFHYVYTEQVSDYVSLYDGRTIIASLIARLSGPLGYISSTFSSTEQYMLVDFVSDSLTNYGGFLATYRTVLDNTPNRTTEPTTTIATTEPIIIPDPCSAAFRPLNLTGFNGTFTSANYPANYTNDARCHWLITSPDPDLGILLEFDDFQTDNCCDLLFIYDGNSRFSDLIAAMYGSYQQPIPSVSSSQRYLYVAFETNEIYTDRGWSARYSLQPPVLRTTEVSVPATTQTQSLTTTVQYTTQTQGVTTTAQYTTQTQGVTTTAQYTTQIQGTTTTSTSAQYSTQTQSLTTAAQNATQTSGMTSSSSQQSTI